MYILNNYIFIINLSILNAPNAIINVLTAYPFFAFGVLLHDFIGTIDKWKAKPIIVSAFFLGLFLVIMSNHYNNYVAMYRCNYGGNMWWFLIGSFAGCMMIYAVSKLLVDISKPIIIISRGTIIILGFHLFFIDLIKSFVYASYLDFLFATVILILFIPIILITERYFPLLAGKYRTNKQQESFVKQRN